MNRPANGLGGKLFKWGTTMKTGVLKEYLGIVVDMEQNVYMQNNILASIQCQIEDAKNAKVFSDPNRPVEPKPNRTTSVFESIFIAVGMGGIVFLAAIIPVGIILDILIGFTSTLENWIKVAIVSFWIGIAYAAFQLYRERCENKEKQEKNTEAKREYQAQLELYEETLVSNQKKRQEDETERAVKTLFLESQKAQVIKSLVASEEHLKEIYEKDIIFPKYRNLVMVCSLYEYICAGRCTELEGHEGAYNILESEIRLDRIINQLDQVITNLEQIRQNQFMLYSAIQKSNVRLGLIMDSTNRLSSRLNDFYNSSIQLNDQTAELNARIAELQASSELTAYYTERAQKELAYMNRMDYLSGRNDAVFFNHPPV